MAGLPLSKFRNKLKQSLVCSRYLASKKKSLRSEWLLFYCGQGQVSFSELRSLVNAILSAAGKHNFHILIVCPKSEQNLAVELRTFLCSGFNCRCSVFSPDSFTVAAALGRASLLWYDTPLPVFFTPRFGQLLIFSAGTYCKAQVLPSLSQSALFRQQLLSANFILGCTQEKANRILQQFCLTDLLSGQFLYAESDSAMSYSKAAACILNFFTQTPVLPAARQQSSKKKRVLIFCSDLRRNGMTTSLLNLMHLAVSDNIQYCFTYREETFETAPQRLLLLPEGAPLLPICGTISCGTFLETLCHSLYLRFHLDFPVLRKKTEQIYARAYAHFFGCCHFDAVIHYTGYSQEFLLLFKAAPAKRILFVHNDMADEYQEKHNFHLGVFTHACQDYEIVAAVSPSVKASLNKIDPTLTNVIVIENTHDAQRVRRLAKQPFVPDPDTAMNVSFAQLETLLSGSKQKFITICRYSPEKGQKKLIRAFSTFHQEHPDSCLILIGGYGPLYDELVSYSTTLSCGEDIVFIRNSSNPFSILKRCDLFLLPSDREPLGLVMLEADSLGIPIAATDIPGSGDFLKRYGGYLVPNSESGLHSAMNAFLSGKLKPLNIDFDEYNSSIVTAFFNLFEL